MSVSVVAKGLVGIGLGGADEAGADEAVAVESVGVPDSLGVPARVEVQPASAAIMRKAPPIVTRFPMSPA